MCDEYCCNHGCNQGRDCPARIERVRVAKEVLDRQAKSDRLRERLMAELHRDELARKHLARVAWILILLVLAAAVAGAMEVMK